MSMAITIWHVMSRSFPYESTTFLNSMEFMDAVTENGKKWTSLRIMVLYNGIVTSELFHLGLRPDMSKLWEECPESLKLFIQKCWDKDPKRRPSMQEIVKFLNGINKKLIWS